jgi:hypothetical protein
MLFPIFPRSRFSFAICPRCFRVFSQTANRNLHFDLEKREGVGGILWLGGLDRGLIRGSEDTVKNHRHALIMYASGLADLIDLSTSWENWTHSTLRPDDLIFVIFFRNFFPKHFSNRESLTKQMTK